jgi:hypothetical protein
MNNKAEMADACLSLRYKYSNLMDCVRGQRPQLLQDPTLSMLLIQMDSLEAAFNNRVRELAGEYPTND